MNQRGPHHSDWFESPRPTARLLAVRPFPRVSGKLGQLWHCLEHLGEIADRRSVEVEYVDTPYGEIAWCDLNANRIMIHRDFDANPALKAFAVAHELGHALDPNFVKLPEDYLKRFRRGSFEVVAEASAQVSHSSAVAGAARIICRVHHLERLDLKSGPRRPSYSHLRYSSAAYMAIMAATIVNATIR